MKVLIVSEQNGKTQKYENVLEHLGIEYEVSISNIDAKEFDGLLIPGGVDINPCLYGQEINGSVDINDVLDTVQWNSITNFVNEKKPILGICRGCQILNVYFGGTLYQDLSTSETHRNDNKGQEKVHYAETVENTGMRKLYGKECIVNTYHHQGCDKLGDGLIITMKAPDGVIEGFEHESLPIVAVQWHPERIAVEYKKEGIADGEKVFRYAFLEKE